MVLSSSAADAGAARAPAWLTKLIRQLEHARRGILYALTEVTPTQLGIVVRALSGAPPWDDGGEGVLEVCLRAPELLGLTRGSRVLLRVRVEDLEWLNLHRPIFADRELRAILWVDKPTLDGLVRDAVDLFDWVSRVVPLPAKALPDFAIEGVQRAMGVGDPFVWMGDRLDEALAAAGSEPALELDLGRTFAELVAELARPGLPVVPGIRSEHDAWRIRVAMARAGRRGSWVALEPAHTPAGMWRLHARQADWDAAAAELRAAGCPRPGLVAAWAELEPEMVAWHVEHGCAAPPEAWDPRAIALCSAPAWTLRRHARAPEVERARAKLRANQETPQGVDAQVLWARGSGNWEPAQAGAVAPRLVRALRSLGDGLPSSEFVAAAHEAGFDDVAAALALVRWERGVDQRAHELVRWLATQGQTTRALDVATAWRDRATRAGDRASLAAAKRQLGELHHQLGNYDTAKNHLEDSVDQLRALSGQAPGDFELRRQLAIALDELGYLHSERGDTERALDTLEDSLAIRRALSAREPECHEAQTELASTLDKVGRVHAAHGHTDTARRYFEDALRIIRRLVELVPERLDFRGNLGVALERLGELHHGLGELGVARRYLEESLVVRRAVAERQPYDLDHHRMVSCSLDALGEAHESLRELELARACFEESLAIARTLAEREPERADFQRDLLLSLRKLGSVRRKLGDTDRARRDLEESLEIARALAERTPDNLITTWDVSVSLSRLGSHHRALGNTDEARRCFEESLEIDQGLVERAPQRLDLRRDLAVGHLELGDLYRVLDDSEQARRHHEDALAEYRTLLEHEPDHPRWKHELATVLAELWQVDEDAARLREAHQILVNLRSRDLLDPAYLDLAEALAQIDADDSDDG